MILAERSYQTKDEYILYVIMTKTVYFDFYHSSQEAHKYSDNTAYEGLLYTIPVIILFLIYVVWHKLSFSLFWNWVNKNII